MKKIIFCIFLLTLSNPASSAIKTLEDFKNNGSDQVYSKHDMDYFVEQGFKLEIQETRGSTTAYVLKKGDDYIGCRRVGITDKTTCYVMELVRK